LLDTIEWHLAVGQDWQTLGNQYDVSLAYLQLVGGPETTVSTISMVYHRSEAPESYRRVIEEARPELEEQMGIEAFSAA
jgi:hypothetical protein